MSGSIRSRLRSTLRTVGRRLWRRLRRTQSVATPPYVGVISEAERCLRDSNRAAAFRAADGLDRLENAIDAAEADGRTKIAERGRIARRRLTDEQARNR